MSGEFAHIVPWSRLTYVIVGQAVTALTVVIALSVSMVAGLGAGVLAGAMLVRFARQDDRSAAGIEDSP